MTTLVVIAKEPLPGKAKTRLHPPLTLAQAAALAAASIDDTIAGVAGLPTTRRVLFYEGSRVPESARGYDVIAQPEGTLDERLAALFDEAVDPMVLIGMDTPQVTAQHLAPAFSGWPASVDVWFGPSVDGGFWALGMREPRGDLIRGVPMSQTDTGAIQRDRLISAGLRVGMLPTLSDVDTIEDARTVARLAPRTGFAAMLNSFEADLGAAS